MGRFRGIRGDTVNARQFGRDGDTYGRHALLKPGGDNVQRDVLHVIPPRVRDGRRVHPTRFDADYIGAHREHVDCSDCWTVDRLTESIAAESSL
jgi:hypothetical protein